MSWEEFKKKQQQTSSWQEFKNRQENRVQQTTKKQETSLWQDIQNFANGAGKASENLFLSAKNGVMSFMQTMQRNNANVQADTADRMNKLNQEMLEKKIKSNPEYSEEIKNVINNPLISSEEIKQKSKENYEEVQAKKSQNILKMEENTDSINNPIGKKIVGEIAPGIGQMLPGMVGGPVGTAYFLGSATGNYYDDALQRGMNEEQAKTYSGIMGAIEGSLESIGANLTKNVGKQLLKKNIKGALINYGLDIGENFLEESIVEPLSELASQTIAGKDKADWSNMGKRMWDSGVTGALISAITGGVSGAVGAVGSKVTQQNAYKDYNTNKSLNKDSQNWLKQAEDIISRNNDSNLQPKSSQSQQNISPQQILLPTQQENVQKASILPMQSYVYEKSDNVKVDSLRQSASKYFNNSEKTKNYMNMLEKIITDKDIDIRFDANLKDGQGRVANGSYFNGVITINPNSNKAGEFIAIHELTHAIGTNQMRNIVEQYRKSNTEFNTAVEQLLKNYNTTEITEEAMADVSAQLFGNQEFINNVAQTEPSLFRKIYNEIKYLWHQFRGYKNQDQFIEDLYYKWTQAYNSNSKLNASENYSIAGKQGMTNAIKNNPINISLERAYNRAQQMQKIGMDNETIRKQTNWFQDRNGDWKFEFSDKDMTLKNIKINKNETYRLKDILKHDTLFIAYPQLENLEIRFKDLNKTNGSYSQKNNHISLNNKLIGSKAKIEGTIIHEIQHAIQNIEGFENGITSKLSKKIYYENLGEIEAADTKKRFIDEKYKKKNISNIAPESSKANPKHRNYDNYIKNRGLLDKAKDSVFKYFKGLGDSDEIIQESLEQIDEETLRGNNEKVWDRLKNDIEESENNSGSFNLPKLKEGYTRLYRGLENEYDANYDRTKLDNSNGYESWTDNYELAKAYGDNVYYIDVPSSEVKNSIIDEDSQSETYGDRNLLYKNDKPVGIKGKSGNEYMLYTDHDNYGNIKYNKIDNNNSTQDNQGRTLTKEQQEFFKDSKVRDEDGNLLEVYHGTKTKGINIFNYAPNRQTGTDYGKAYYFTTDYIKAQGYQYDINKDPKFIEYDKIGKEYLDKVFATSNENEKKKIVQEWADWEKENSATKLLYDENFTPERLPDGETKKLYLNIKKPYIADAKGQYYFKVYDKYFKEARANGNDGIIVKNVIDVAMGKHRPIDVYIAFNENQIKNVDNTNPTTNPDIRYSLPTKEWQQYLDENYKPTGTRTNLEDIRLPVKEDSTKSSFNLPPANEEAKVANILNKPAEKVKEKDRSWAIIKANVIDKGMVFEELSRKTGNRKLQGKWDYTLTSTARGQNAIGNARYELDPNTKTQKQISKSLTDIIDEVGENTSDFYAYMYHQLNIDRMTLEDRFDGDTGINYERKKAVKNKPVFGEGVTAEISRKYVQELEQKHPEFKEWAQDVYEYLDANTKELVESGVISKETQELFKEMYPHYVPISRVTNKGQAINVPLDTGRTGINSPIKKATGGSKDINPLFETMADRTLQTYRAAARNSFGVELKNAINQNKQSNQTSEQVDIDIIMENMTDEEQNKQLLQEGKNGEKPTFTVFENGNKVTYEITKDMYDALKPKNDLLAKIDESKVSKVANKINNFRRGLLTEYNPVFSITNAIKDAQDILLNSQHSAKTYAKILEATAQLLSKGYWYNEYIQNGGAQNSYFKDGEFETTKNNLPTKIKNTLTFPLRAISNVNNVIEMAPRLAEYIASREQGRSIETSMLDAARVTTNFKAGGDVTKTLNRNGFTFLNASVQGMQQQIRNIQEANAKGLKGYAVLACKYAIAAAPVLLLNNLIWADDDDYEELQDYVKDNYYIIGKSSNGKFLRIPKGRAVATIQKIVSNVSGFVKNDTINSDEVGKVFWEDMKENIQFGMDNLAPNNPLENNILSPIFQAITNKTWYGEDLVPSRLQKKPSEEQYDESTDNFSRWLGEKTGISPIKINYLIDQYSGGVGDILLPLGTPQAENNVIEDKFTTDATMKSKYPGEFFSKVDELEINKNSSKATDEDILKYKYIDSVSTDIGELYTKKREIQNSSATDKEKKAQLKEVQEQINELAKNSLEEVEKIQNTSTTARIGDKEYYKYHGEWTSLSEEETKKNKKLSLKTYADYKNKVYNQTQAKRASGELEENQSLKNKDKIGILLNSKYPNSEISAIYDNYIRSSNDTEYTIMKSTGIDIKEYLGYKQQEFTSDKIDDGTLKEKTVSKSEQKKVVEYLNSMNIKGNQRLLLYAMRGYTTTSSQKTQLANYVKTLKIDKDTKLELYDKFSGFTVYKDGTIKW